MALCILIIVSGYAGSKRLTNTGSEAGVYHATGVIGKYRSFKVNKFKY